MTTQKFNLSIIPGGINPKVNVSQYDKGQTFEPSPDPLLEEAQGYVKDIKLGESDAAKVKELVMPLLKDASIFGTDLEAAGLTDKILGYFMELIADKGAIRKTLHGVVSAL